MRKALAQSQSPLAKGPLGSGSSGWGDGRAPARATHWDAKIPQGPKNKERKEGEAALLGEAAHF